MHIRLHIHQHRTQNADGRDQNERSQPVNAPIPRQRGDPKIKRRPCHPAQSAYSEIKPESERRVGKQPRQQIGARHGGQQCETQPHQQAARKIERQGVRQRQASESRRHHDASHDQGRAHAIFSDQAGGNGGGDAGGNAQERKPCARAAPAPMQLRDHGGQNHAQGTEAGGGDEKIYRAHRCERGPGAGRHMVQARLMSAGKSPSASRIMSRALSASWAAMASARARCWASAKRHSSTDGSCMVTSQKRAVW